MKRIIDLSAPALAALLVIIVLPLVALASDGAPDADPAAEWVVDTVVSGWNVGPHMAVASDPESGETFISFYDGVNRDLYLAWTGGPNPGNCGPSNEWTCLLLDSGGDVGQHNDIAVGGEGPWGLVWVSYYDATNGSLKVAHPGFWRLTGEVEFNPSEDVYVIDEGDLGSDVSKGKHTSITLNPSGFAHIAYQASNNSPTTDESQMYAYQVWSGMGNCGVDDQRGWWQCDTIFSDEGVGEGASIALDDWEVASIAFYDGGRGHPIVATYHGPGGHCGPLNRWVCRSVEHPGESTGQYVSLYIEDTNVPHIAYYNETSDSLEYAAFVGSGGNCGFSSLSMQWEWQCDWIDDIGFSITSMGIAINEDENGYPIIAYQDVPIPIGPAALKIARPYAAVDWNPNPNCGPIDLIHTWVCEMMDGGGATRDEADVVSLALDKHGDAVVAYRELDSYPFPAEGSIKVARESSVVFANGFDSGDLSWWSLVGP